MHEPGDNVLPCAAFALNKDWDVHFGDPVLSFSRNRLHNLGISEDNV